MHAYDIVAIGLVVGATLAFIMGGFALSRSEDLFALYWLVAGAVSLRASVHIARSGVKR